MDDFTGDPWHPFLRLLRRRAARLPPVRRALAISGQEAWEDLFRHDEAAGKSVPARELSEADITALAEWLDLSGEERATFLQLGSAFLAQSDSLRQLREELQLPDDE